jgi:hypothetical protein
MMLPAIPVARQDIFSGSEIAALRTMQTITIGQVEYASQFGKYAGSLVELGPRGANLIPASLASGQQGGYIFSVGATQSGFLLHAAPVMFGVTGKRTFYADQTMIIHQNWGAEPASSDSPEFK